MRKPRPSKGGRKAVAPQGPFLPETRAKSLSIRKNPCGLVACSLFVLDKGKPVVRPGRKAKGRGDYPPR
jgi:hypothetical protein